MTEGETEKRGQRTEALRGSHDSLSLFLSFSLPKLSQQQQSLTLTCTVSGGGRKLYACLSYIPFFVSRFLPHKSLCQFLKKKVISLQNPIQGHSFSLSPVWSRFHFLSMSISSVYLSISIFLSSFLCPSLYVTKFGKKGKYSVLWTHSRVHFSFHLDRNLTRQDKDITGEGQERDGRLFIFNQSERETREMNWLKRRREGINQVLDLTADWWPIVNDTQSMKRRRRDCEATWRFVVKNVLFIWSDCKKIPCPPVCC